MSDRGRARGRGPGLLPGSRAGRRRPGVALVAAVVALVVVGALAAGLVHAVQHEQRSAREALAGERALAAAELALAGVPGTWRGAALDSLGVGTSATRASGVGTADPVALRVTRATEGTVWAVAEAQSGVGRGRARRAASMLFRVQRGPADSAVLRPVTGRAWVQTF